MSAILVVEQDPGYANRIVAALQAAGHEVVSASSRDEAEQATSSRGFDLVLANGMMPGAADLLGRFSEERGGPGSLVLLPVTLASHTEAAAYSADGILSKPFSDEDLERMVSGRLAAGSSPVASEEEAPAAPTPAAPQTPVPQTPAPQSPAPQSPAPQSPAPQTPAPQTPTPQPEAPKPPAPKPAGPPAKPRPVRPTVDSDIDDLLNKTLSGLDISSLTRKRPKPRPETTPPQAPKAETTPPQAPKAETTPPQAPKAETPAPQAPRAETTPPGPPSQPAPSQAPPVQTPQPPAPATQPTPAAAPPQTPAAAPSKSVSLTSTDIFGEVLAEVEAESEKTRRRESATPAAAAPTAAPAQAPTPTAPTQISPPKAETPQSPPQQSPPQQSPPQQSPTAPAPTPAQQPPPASRRTSYDDDLDRKLEETLSGVLPSRLRRKAEEKPPPQQPAPSPPPPQQQPTASTQTPAAEPATVEPDTVEPNTAEPTTAEPSTAEPAAPTPPSQDFGPPSTAAPPAAEPPELAEPSVDFTEDETVSIVRPVAPPRDQDADEDFDFFATTHLPTRPAPGKPATFEGSPEASPEPPSAPEAPTAPAEAASTEVQPPDDFRPLSETSPDVEPPAEPDEEVVVEPPVAEPQVTTESPPPPQLPDFGDDDFDLSFGETEPAGSEVDENIWSAYGTEETSGWGTTSFEAQAPGPAAQTAAQDMGMDDSAAPSPAASSEPAASEVAASEAAASEPAPQPPAEPPPRPSGESTRESTGESTAWGTDSGWGSDTGWGTPVSPEEPAAEEATSPEVSAPEPPAPEPAAPEPAAPEPPSTAGDVPAADFGSDSVWEVPSFEEESGTSEVSPPPAESAPPEPPTFDSGRLGTGDFQVPDFDSGPSLQEDPELEFDADFESGFDDGSDSGFDSGLDAGFDSGPDSGFDSGFDSDVDSGLDPDLPPPSTTDSETARPATASDDLGDLSSELGAEDTGTFHTALQGVLQIRGDDAEGASRDDQGIPFGDYRLLERVAVGGMAEVWRARRRGVEGFQKTVAIKRILSHLTGSTDFVNMFIDEAKLAAQLNHANIAQIYDLGKVDDDFYIAMEFVEGRDLRTLLREANQKDRPLPMGQALFIIAAVARALDYAHRKRDFEDRDLGLVHRDVSPQNVLVSTEGEIKLCDFGIVKAVAKASTTQMGALKGKLQYMSPEQAWGKEVDGRSDIFSLGTVMFEALTGEKLFTGDSEIGVLDAVRDCRVKSARAIDPSLPEAVEGILQKALTAAPEDRYQTAGEMERDLQSVLETLKPSPGQSDLSRYMHGLLEAPEPRADQGSSSQGTAPRGPSASGDAAGDTAGDRAGDDSAGAWTGTSWGTASFYEEDADAASEPVSAKVPVGTSVTPEPSSSKATEPASSPAPEPASKPAKPKGGGKLIWILLVLTMLAIIAVVAWTQLRGGGDVPAAGAEPVAAPAEATPEPATAGATTDEATTDEATTEGEATPEDTEALMQQMLQEEMERKKKEMEEQFEAQRRELERRMKEVQGDDDG